MEYYLIFIFYVKEIKSNHSFCFILNNTIPPYHRLYSNVEYTNSPLLNVIRPAFKENKYVKISSFDQIDTSILGERV